ncbi:MAG: FeoB small GTPase domain-containing protein [Chloroflexota bacterium]|nr:FeoB small GTPase domain-containing protein [Chloroflexota bacterium]
MAENENGKNLKPTGADRSVMWLEEVERLSSEDQPEASPDVTITIQPIPESSGGCESCAVHNAANLHKLGVDMEDWDYVVALAGNPNVGKSTVFNALTGLRQHTGNWPGKTVARAEGGYEYGGDRYKLVDLPGTYSLLATSMDEEVARDFILFGQPDVTLVVVDATRLERNLNLVLQVSEITDRVVIALNLIDEARRHGLTIDHRRLARDLGVPVVPIAARSRENLDALLQAIAEVATGKTVGKPHRVKGKSRELQNAVTELASQIEAVYPGLPNARWVALRLLDGDQRIIDAIQRGELGDLTHGDAEQRVQELNLTLEPAR